MQRTGRRGEAVRLLTDLAVALAADGKAQDAREIRIEAAQIAFDGKDYEQVGEVLRPLLQPGADPAARFQAVLLQADALSRAGSTEEALALLAGEAGEKTSPALESRRGEVLVRGGREAEGLQVLSSLASRGDEGAALAAAQGYQRLERYEDSIPVLEKITAAHADQIVPGFLLGAAYERTGRRDQAVAEFRRLLARDPEFHAALNYLGYTFADAGVNLDEALTLVSRAVALDPDNGSYVDSLGWAYFRLGRFEEARKQLERAARLEPEDATLQEHLGDVYVALGQMERAKDAYQRALELGDDNKEQVRRKLEDLGDTPRR
jgi:tetratricopeptide (TPR) repeat protein